MNALTNTNGQQSAAIEAAIVQGDLSGLTPPERVAYYMKVCESLGLNPLTKPFDYLKLNGKLQLYALRGCTDQLRKINGISVTALTEATEDGVHTVTAEVRGSDGRTDQDKGCVTIKGLQGEALANAKMKATTKAKRRAERQRKDVRRVSSSVAGFRVDFSSTCSGFSICAQSALELWKGGESS